jgi:hypothetical protein
MSVNRLIQSDEVGTGQALEVGLLQVRRGSLDIFQDGKKPFAAFHFVELLAAEETGERLRHVAGWGVIGKS